jgi:hypothetical protein
MASETGRLRVKEEWTVLKYDGEGTIGRDGEHKEPREIWHGDDKGVRRLYRAPNLWYEAPSFSGRVRSFFRRRKRAVQETIRALRAAGHIK